MSEETLRLSAELALDKFSPRAKQMIKDLAEIREASEKANAPGAKVAKLHAKAYSELSDKISGAAGTIRGVLSPSMAALGITGFAAGESIAKVIDGLKEAAKNYHLLNDASRRSGMTVDSINGVSMAFERLGVAPGAALQMMGDFGEHMDRLQRGRPAEINLWKNLGYSDLYETLGVKLAGAKSRMDQLKTVFEWAQDPSISLDKKRDVFGMLGYDKSLASKNGAELREAYKKGFEYEKEHPENILLNKQLQNAFADLTEAAKGFQWQMNETFGPRTIVLVERLSKFILQLGDDIRASSAGKKPFVQIDKGSIADRLLHWKETFDEGRGFSEEQKQQKLMSDRGQLAEKLAGGMSPIAYHPGGSGSQAETMLSNGVKVGMLAAFREWFASVSSGGVTNASYEAGGGSGGGTPRFGSKDFPAVDGSNPALGGSVPKSAHESSAQGGGQFRSGRTGIAKAAAIDQLRREGVPEANLEHAASLLTGQAIAESGLNPNTVHDGGTGYGIYGAGKGRRSAMLNWLAKNGYAKNSLEGQMKYMAHEAMTGPAYAASRAALLRAGEGNMQAGARTLTHNFEAPAVENWGARLKDSMTALRTPMFNGNLPGAARAAGEQRHTVTGDAALKIDLNGFPRGTKTDLTYGGLFTEYTLSKGQQMETSEQK